MRAAQAVDSFDVNRTRSTGLFGTTENLTHQPEWFLQIMRP